MSYSNKESLKTRTEDSEHRHRSRRVIGFVSESPLYTRSTNRVKPAVEKHETKVEQHRGMDGRWGTL